MDAKAVVQEVQDRLHAAAQRGQDRLHKGQEQIHKGQERARKGRAAAAGVIRAGRDFAKTVRPSIGVPTVKIPPLSTLTNPARAREHAQEVASQVLTAQRELADKARQKAGPVADKARQAAGPLADRARQKASPLAEQVLASQRHLATKAVEVATPVVADGIVKLSRVVAALQSARKVAQPDTTSAEVTAVVDTETPLDTEPADSSPADPRRADATVTESAKPASRKAAKNGVKSGAGKSSSVGKATSTKK